MRPAKVDPENGARIGPDKLDVHPREPIRGAAGFMTVAQDAAAGTGPGTSAEPAQRLCGRCRCVLPDDPTLFFQTDWVLCSPCEAVLLPGRFPAHTE